jgi:aminoglycoside phosphotransferase (APT) family kinase protein
LGYAGPLQLQKLEGGQSNPTFKLIARSGNYILRRKPIGSLLSSAHAVDREFRVLRALAGTDVPVARAHALCEDDSVIGSSFYVMDFVDGRIFWDTRLPGLLPTERRAIFESMNDTLAKLHTLDYTAIGLADFGKPGNYLARQIARWTKQYRASEIVPIEAMNRLIDWLPLRIPPMNETRVVHGDYKMDNMIFHKAEPRILAVIDWELSTLGDPLVDFAYHVMAWRIAPDLFRGLAGADLQQLGIPSEEEHVASYCRRTNRSGIPNLNFYLVFCMFRLAAILQGILKRAADSTAASNSAVDVGSRGRAIAEQGWALAQTLE